MFYDGKRTHSEIMTCKYDNLNFLPSKLAEAIYFPQGDQETVRTVLYTTFQNKIKLLALSFFFLDILSLRRKTLILISFNINS